MAELFDAPSLVPAPVLGCAEEGAEDHLLSSRSLSSFVLARSTISFKRLKTSVTVSMARSMSSLSFPSVDPLKGTVNSGAVPCGKVLSPDPGLPPRRPEILSDGVGNLEGGSDFGLGAMNARSGRSAVVAMVDAR